MHAEVLGLLAVFLTILGYSFYAAGIKNGKIKPHGFSWLIWAILTGIAFFAQMSDGAGPGAWATGATALGSLIFALIGFSKDSRSYIKKIDYVFFVASLIGLPLWYVTGNPVWSVILITIIDALAFIPSYRKAYLHPFTESVCEKTLNGSKYIFAIFALQNFSITTALYPASLLILNLAFATLLIFRRK